MTDEIFKFYKENQLCKDKELTEKFSAFHGELVDRIIQFCEENNIECDAFSLWTTGLQDSKGWHQWTPGTDSSCSFFMNGADRGKTPFLHEI